MSKYDSYQLWLDGLQGKASTTIEVYVRYFNRFCAYLGESPEQMIDHQIHVTNHPPTDRRDAKKYEYALKRYMQQLKAEGASSSLRKTTWYAVLHFFATNDYPLNTMRGDAPSKEGVKGAMTATKAQIKRIIEHIRKPLYRAVVMACKDSGLRLNDVLGLRWQDIHEFDDGRVWGFEVETMKTGYPAKTFFFYETVEYIRDNVANTDPRIFPCSDKSIQNVFFRARNNAGYRENRLSPHSLRKYFNNQLMAYLPREIRMGAMGKDTGSSEYEAISLEQLWTRYYREHWQHLALYDDAAPHVAAELERLREKNEEQHQLLLQMGDTLRKFQRRVMYLEELTGIDTGPRKKTS